MRAEPTGPSAARWPVTVVDGSGATVTVATAPRTILSADPAATATLAALGLDAGVTVRAATTATLAAAGAADLIVVPAAATVPETVDPTRVFRWGASDPRRSGRVIAALALAVGRGAAGLALGRQVDADVAAQYARAAAEPPTPTLIQVAPLRVAGWADPVARLLAPLGAVSVFPIGRTVSFAAIQAKAPAVWLAVVPPASTLVALRRVGRLRRVPAVRDGRFAVLDPGAFAPSPALPKAIAALVRLLHPAA
jgi:ABC-type Fe3+-hydroxamate transport system substrate-binding protein